MSDFRRQFVIREDSRGRWLWSLFEAGMTCVAKSHASSPTREACLAETRRLAVIANAADVWDSEQLVWVTGPTAPPRRRTAAPNLRLVSDHRAADLGREEYRPDAS